MSTQSEYGYMTMAVEAAAGSVAEDDSVRPMVGAVLVKDGEVLATACRGELGDGDHAEYTLLEKKLAGIDVAGATVYTTLEPCTVRNHPKVPCARRLVDRQVARVVVGQLDPNPQIRGEGLLTLRDAKVDIDVFPADLMARLEDLNRHFIRAYRAAGNPGPDVDEQFLTNVKTRQLDEWYRRVNATYWNRNFSIQPAEIYAHLSEVVGGLSSVASEKYKPGVDPQRYLAKSIAWWMTLCGKMGIRSVEEMVWDKFPNACAYCHRDPHDPNVCTEMKEASKGVMWESLEELGRERIRPKRLGDWQRMFGSIYPAQQTEVYGPSFARLNEELGELAEAVRVFNAVPGYYLSEAADVFAWLMHIQNILDLRKKIKSENRGHSLEEAFARAYPDGCQDCGQRVCTCPPILASTIGRIAHEVPRRRGGFGETGRFMTTEEASRTFRRPR